MSRSNYNDDIDNWQLIRWRGQVVSAIRGSRGQKLLRDLLAALDAMPVRSLIAHELESNTGAVCALGALGNARGMDMSTLDPDDAESVAAAFNMAPQLAREIVHVNDECSYVTPKLRWTVMRDWVASKVSQ